MFDLWLIPNGIILSRLLSGRFDGILTDKVGLFILLYIIYIFFYYIYTILQASTPLLVHPLKTGEKGRTHRKALN